MRGARVRVRRPSVVAAGDLNVSLEMADVSDTYRVFQQAIIDGDLREFHGSQWPFEGDLRDHGVVLASDGNTRVFRLGDAVVYVGAGGGWFSVRAAASSQERAQEVVEAFAADYPALFHEPADYSGTVPVTFWTYGPFGPSSRLRRIDATEWDGVAVNYPSDVRGELERLMTSFEPGAGGQLILWQGPPGTGKTWALRALAAAWRDWAEFHYITDPEAFFVTNPDYMIELLLADTYEALVPAEDVDAAPEVASVARDGKWRLLVLEDTGELLAANAKEQQGQGLSRLLNVVDGMVGQGLRILVLVTTNDELGDLHPAVKRPGRCASALEFGPFPPAEANVWLASIGARGEVDEPATLAELYALGNETPDDEAAAVAADLAAAHTLTTVEAQRRMLASGGFIRPSVAYAFTSGGLFAATRAAGPSAAEALTAGAIVATSDMGREIGAVAEQHAPEGGYGGTAWNASTATVFWVPADWSTNDEIAACEAAFLAIDGVDNLDYEAEGALPEGPDWEVVYSDTASGDAALDDVVGLARLPLEQELA